LTSPKVRFGPGGVPIQCKGRSTLEGVQCCKDIGLDAMEMEFVQGVRIKKEMAEEVGKLAKKLDISLSSHAPYFVNFCSTDKKKIATSIRNILQASEATFHAGGRITVFHPGFYQKSSPEDAFKTAKENLKEAKEKINKKKIKCILGAETVGKKSQFGGFEEVIKLSEQLSFIEPVIDFAHVHARGDISLKTADDYRKLFSILEKRLGNYVKHFHAHFSEVEFSEKGERRHLPLGTKNIPPYKPLIKVIAEQGYSGTIISETPKLDYDAQKMQKEYKRLRK